VCAGGAEKVTEGTGYLNPAWPAARKGLLAVAAHGFVPAAYMFLDPSGSGQAQAQWFAREAGDLSRFGIAVDLERSSGGSPTRQQAVDAVAELRHLYPAHPIGGYAPHWYTGGEDLSFFDWLWASEYVSGSGDPGVLYRGVPASWWAPYGGKSPLMLQFTSSATIAGIGGAADCSAFLGTAAPTQEAAVADPGILVPLNLGQPHVNLPVAESLPSSDFRIVVTGDTGCVVTATAWFTDGSAAQVATYGLNNGKAASVVFRKPWPEVSTVRLQRQDTKTALSASAFVRF